MQDLKITFGSKVYPFKYVEMQSTPHEKTKELLEKNFGVSNNLIAIDTETRKIADHPKAGLLCVVSEVRLIQLWNPEAECGVVLDVGGEKVGCELNVKKNYVWLHKFLEGHKLIAHNALFDLQMMSKYAYKYGLRYQNPWYCTQGAWQIITQRTHINPKLLPHKLSNLVEQYLGIPMDKEEQASDWGGELTKSQIEYAAKDVIGHYQLMEKLFPEILKYELVELFDLNTQSQQMVAEMNVTGFPVDTKLHNKLIGEWQAELEKLTEQCFEVLNDESCLTEEDIEEIISQKLIKKYREEVLEELYEANPESLSEIKETAQEFVDSLGPKLPESKPYVQAFKRVVKNVDEYQISPTSANKVATWLEEKLPDHIIFGDADLVSYQSKFLEWKEDKDSRMDKFEMEGSWPRGRSGYISVKSDILIGMLSDRDVGDDTLFEKIQTILKFKTYDKLLTTYGENLANYLVKGRIHPNFDINRTNTGRFSSNNPNIQNQPARGVGKAIKAIYHAPKGYKIVVADFGQIELRVAAHLSGDKTMLEAYAQGKDLHSITAAQEMRLSFEEFCKLSKEERDLKRYHGKAQNFGLIFGAGAKTLKNYARISYGVDFTLEESYEKVSQWKALYSGLVEWQERTAFVAKEHGFTETLLGRVRKLGEKYYSASMNTAVQGTAAEINRKGGINIVNKFYEKKLKSRLICNVHDEYVTLVPEAEVSIASEIIKESMESAMLWAIPDATLIDLAEVNVGDNWLEAK